MRKYPHEHEHRVKHQTHYASHKEVSKNIYDKKFTTLTTHSNVRNYYNEKCAKYLMFDIKNTEELSFMTLKGNTEFEEKLTCGLGNDRNMQIFTRAIESLKIGILMRSINPK